MRKTKKIWRTVVVNDDELLEFFSKLGEGDLTDEMYQEAERFVCKMYGSKTITSVNQLRSNLFWTRLRKNDRVPDLCTLPPCSSTLRKHTTRAHYVTKMWRCAGTPIQSLDRYDNNGWLPDGSIDWIDEVFPANIETLLCGKKEADADDSENVEEDDRELTDMEDSSDDDSDH